MNTITWYDELDSPLGRLVLAAGRAGLCGVYFTRQKWFPADTREWVRDPVPLAGAADWLNQYFAGGVADYAGPLSPTGTEFQREVWRMLQKIPRGRTATYGDVALLMGRPTAHRAVGAAIGRNPISLIIPCHRVVGADGRLTGYAGGLERKEHLLRLEGWRP